MRILLSNDDGWDQPYLRHLYEALWEMGHDAIISAPLSEHADSGARDIYDYVFNTNGHIKGPTVGSVLPERRAYYVDSYPVTAARYGLEIHAGTFWPPGKCDLVIAASNSSWSVGARAQQSGAANIAMWAAMREGIPAIVFSGQHAEDTVSIETRTGLILCLVERLAQRETPCLPR
ncbi:survival protein sure-like phosphatase/nucleotidase [Xylariomycetidae sp. FL2044]|nr:survival protein sure-like phosphatase/nucleotidase [Xylariomycetidae sp. FL2044]